MDRVAVVKFGAVAGAGVCVLFGGAVLAQYIFTMKKKAGRKTKIIEMVSEREAGLGANQRENAGECQRSGGVCEERMELI